MDTVTAFCRSPEGGNLTVDGFVVAGGSKRGWTTWTTAAVDRRVVAIAPMVIDLLNIVPSFQHHLAVYGYYAPAVTVPKTRPRISAGMRSNSTEPMIGLSGPAPRLKIKVVVTKTAIEG